MKWKKYTIFTTTEAEDMVSLMLTENGVEGVEIEDNVPLSDEDTKGMFIDILPETAPDNGEAKVSFYLHLADNEEKTVSVTVNECGQPQPGDTGESGRDAGTDRAAASDDSYEIRDRL